MRRRTSAVLLIVAVLLLAGFGPCQGDHKPDPKVRSGNSLRMDDIQVLASHNSYHLQAEPPLFAALRAFLGAGADALEYTHHPLADEFDAGVRQIELDLFVDDPGGGRYASPKLVRRLRLAPVDPAMSQPGTKVFHIQEVDYRSTCPTFVTCLVQVRDWSDAHPGHLPIVVQVEPKDDVIPDPGFGFVTPLPWDGPAFATVEDEIRSVFADDRIITPGAVQGDHPTLADAVRDDGWPTLKKARGKVMFTMDNTGAARTAYRGLHPVVADRLIFVAARPPDADAAVVVANDPIGGAAEIRRLVEQHFLVRTRADADTVQARTGDTTQQRAAWASGAHFVSTDYVFPDELFGTGYVAEVPGGGVTRCNPVSAPKRCAKVDIPG